MTRGSIALSPRSWNVLESPGISAMSWNVLDFLVFLEIVLNCPEILPFTNFLEENISFNLTYRFIVFYVFLLVLLFFYAEQGVLILFFSLGVMTLLMTPVTQVRFTCKILQILWEETKQGGVSDLLFGYDDPTYYLSQPFSQYWVWLGSLVGKQVSV